MSISNNDAVKLVKELKAFCQNKSCSSCCFADDLDGHCLLTDVCPSDLDIKTFVKQADELIEQ